MEHTLRANGAGTVRRRPLLAGAAGRRERPPRGRGAGVNAAAGAPEPLRIANCSGFFGDRLSAAREMVEGGPIDVLTGDWLAELTMYILHKTRERSGGYARTFLRELEDVLPACVERGITVVSNAGGLDPEGLAAAVRELARRQGLEVRVASVSGDDITPRLAELRAAGEAFVNLDTGEPLPAGGRGRDGQCVPARPPDRRRAGRRGAGGGDGPGHRRRARRRAGAARLRVGRHRPRRHRRRRGGGPCHRVRRAVLRRQLRLLRGGAAPGADRLPHRGDARRRLVGHHQAPGHGRRGDGRDGDGAAALRDREPALPQPRRGGPLRHHRADAGRARPGAHRGRARGGAPAHAESHGQPRRGLAQFHDARADRRRRWPTRPASPPTPCGPASPVAVAPSPSPTSS